MKLTVLYKYNMSFVLLSPQVCRHDETSATLISNSSVAQEADPRPIPKEDVPPYQHDSRQDVVEEVVWEGNFDQLEPLGNIHDLVQAATITGGDHMSPSKSMGVPEMKPIIDEKPVMKPPVRSGPRIPPGEGPYRRVKLYSFCFFFHWLQFVTIFVNY